MAIVVLCFELKITCQCEVYGSVVGEGNYDCTVQQEYDCVWLGPHLETVKMVIRKKPGPWAFLKEHSQVVCFHPTHTDCTYLQARNETSQVRASVSLLCARVSKHLATTNTFVFDFQSVCLLLLFTPGLQRANKRAASGTAPVCDLWFPALIRLHTIRGSTVGSLAYKTPLASEMETISNRIDT